MRKDTRSYLISIKGVQGVPAQEVNAGSGLMPMQGARYFMEYYMTLFNKDIGTHGSFYGRTYRSQPIPLKDAGGTWNHSTEDFVYFHTNYIEKTSFLVVECVLVRDVAGLKSYSSAGYALCDIFQFKGMDTVELTKGTPRSIGLLGLEAVSKG